MQAKDDVVASNSMDEPRDGNLLPPKELAISDQPQKNTSGVTNGQAGVNHGSSGERFREKAFLAIIVAVLSFSGGVGGSFLASRLEADRWQRETKYSLRKEIFAKRMELLERTIRVFNALQTLDIYKASGDYSQVAGEHLLRSKGGGEPNLEAVVESVVKVKETQAELSAVMTLDAVYFGPKTRTALKGLQKALLSTETWWKVDGAKTQAVLDAAGAELDLGLTGPL